MPAVTKAFDSDFEVMSSRHQRGQKDGDALVALPTNEKENSSRENNVAKIKVVVCCFGSSLPPICVRLGKKSSECSFLDGLLLRCRITVAPICKIEVK